MTSVRAGVETAQGAATRVAALKLDQLTVLVPQVDMRSLESAIDVSTEDIAPGAIGTIALRDERLPVYCLSHELQRLDARPSSRRICAVLRVGDRAFGLLCSEVALLSKSDLPAHAMPKAMVLPGSPIHGLALHEDSIACLSSAARLLAYLESPLPDGADRPVRK